MGIYDSFGEQIDRSQKEEKIRQMAYCKRSEASCISNLPEALTCWREALALTERSENKEQILYCKKKIAKLTSFLMSYHKTDDLNEAEPEQTITNMLPFNQNRLWQVKTKGLDNDGNTAEIVDASVVSQGDCMKGNI